MSSKNLKKALEALKTETSKTSDEILYTTGPALLTTMQTIMTDTLKEADVSKVEATFAKSSDPKNEALAQGLSQVRSVVDATVGCLKQLERMIALSVPQMEDGNNFGVVVQAAVAKHLKDNQDELVKELDKFPAFFASRAEALEKWGAEGKTTATETKSESRSDSKGGKDGDESKSSTSNSKEEKITKSVGGAGDVWCRQSHLVALDVQMYMTLRRLVMSTMTILASSLDTFEKNKGKIEAPKGTGGNNAMSMF